MTDTNIYRDIAQRTGGDIYIGVVGPVRTGKSTFIKRFFETVVVPNVPADFARERMIDELPQSSAGRTIMTTEPKFVPEKAVAVTLANETALRVRLVDCVGYIVPSSLGYIENEAPRMVKTPWYEDEIPFNMAAEIGTKKVITEHATIGLVVTTDGSISEIPREEYEEAEERVIEELEAIHKPYVILLNCMYPESNAAVSLAAQLSDKYHAPVLPINCLELTRDQIKDILYSVLCEFPLKKIVIRLPGWVSGLPEEVPLRKDLLQCVEKTGASVYKVSDAGRFAEELQSLEAVTFAKTEQIDLGNGNVTLYAQLQKSYFYDLISDITGEEIRSDASLVESIRALAQMRRRYERIATALEQVNSTGYGIVMPSVDELTLEEPEIVKQGNRYGVRLKAGAPSIHMLRADIKTEVAPIVGSEKQSEDLVKYLLDGFGEDPGAIWKSNIFGKSLEDLVNEGLRAKLMHMPNDARMKLQQTLERVINEGCNGLICIII